MLGPCLKMGPRAAPLLTGSWPSGSSAEQGGASFSYQSARWCVAGIRMPIPHGGRWLSGDRKLGHCFWGVWITGVIPGLGDS